MSPGLGELRARGISRISSDAYLHDRHAPAPLNGAEQLSYLPGRDRRGQPTNVAAEIDGSPPRTLGSFDVVTRRESVEIGLVAFSSRATGSTTGRAPPPCSYRCIERPPGSLLPPAGVSILTPLFIAASSRVLIRPAREVARGSLAAPLPPRPPLVAAVRHGRGNDGRQAAAPTRVGEHGPPKRRREGRSLPYTLFRSLERPNAVGGIPAAWPWSAIRRSPTKRSQPSRRGPRSRPPVRPCGRSPPRPPLGFPCAPREASALAGRLPPRVRPSVPPRSSRRGA